jgi:GNAT superfamily N-acetyltransferase
MIVDSFIVQTVAERAGLVDRIEALTPSVWPAYVTQSHMPKGHSMPWDWYGLYSTWPQFQFALLDPSTDELLATGHAVPLAWDDAAANLPDTGWNWALYQGKMDYMAGRKPTLLSALSVTVDRTHQRRGLSAQTLRAMRALAKAAGFARLIAPVRPMWKQHYPITPMQDYISWTTDDGLPFDPWIRVHARLGAKIIKECSRSMVLAGAVEEWERWSGMKFPADGDYVVPTLLAPLHVNHGADECIYVEPNVWMEHTLHSMRDFVKNRT